VGSVGGRAGIIAADFKHLAAAAPQPAIFPGKTGLEILLEGIRQAHGIGRKTSVERNGGGVLYILYNGAGAMTKTPRGMEEASREYKLEDTALQIRKIGNSVGVILPKELLARLNLKEGDKFYPVEQPDGSLRLSPFNPKHARTMEIARQVMHEYRDTFAALAK